MNNIKKYLEEVIVLNAFITAQENKSKEKKLLHNIRDNRINLMKMKENKKTILKHNLMGEEKVKFVGMKNQTKVSNKYSDTEQGLKQKEQNMEIDPK